jgi:multidrug efflux pump subunit AcrB
LRLNKKDRTKSNLIEQLYITGNQIRLPIANLIDRQYALGTTEISRSDFQRTIIITADTIGGYTATEAVKETKILLSSFMNAIPLILSTTIGNNPKTVVAVVINIG